MSEWKEYRLGDIASVQTGPFGSQLHQEDYVEIGTPIITVEHLGDNRITYQNLPKVTDKDRERLKKYWLQTGDVVFSRVGSVDRRAYVTEKENGWLFSGRCLRVRADEQAANGLFLSYYFGQESFKDYVRRIAVGATMPSINTQILSDVEITLPDLQTQIAIAKTLSSLDDKIELNNQINANLEALAQAIFKQWFIDFEFPDENGNPYKCSGGKMVESEMGLIPEGWKAGSIRDLVNYGNETMNVGNLTLENYISTENMLQDYGGITKASSLPSTKTVKAFSKNNILVSNIRPYFKKIFFPPFAGGCSADVIVFVPNSSLYSDYAYQAMRNDAFFAYVMTGARGTKMPRGDKSHIIKFPITIPSNSVLEFFSDISRSLSLKIQENTRENQGLESLRDALIPQLITGKIQIQL